MESCCGKRRSFDVQRCKKGVWVWRVRVDVMEVEGRAGTGGEKEWVGRMEG